MQAVRAAGIALDDIDLFVYHQANGRILSAVGERLGLPADRVVDCISEYGNTSAATLPLALAYVEDEGRLSRATCAARRVRRRLHVGRDRRRMGHAVSGRVVITGVGAVTPLGNTARELHEGWLAGRVGIEDGLGALHGLRSRPSS